MSCTSILGGKHIIDIDGFTDVDGAQPQPLLINQ
jgi:hypothetical protein